MSTDARSLFREVALDAEPDDDRLDEQIAALIFRVHGRRAAADDPDRLALATLWRDSYTGDPAAAWSVVLSALLRHPDFVQY